VVDRGDSRSMRIVRGAFDISPQIEEITVGNTQHVAPLLMHDIFCTQLRNQQIRISTPRQPHFPVSSGGRDDKFRVISFTKESSIPSSVPWYIYTY
jgi:hypothetical protein